MGKYIIVSKYPKGNDRYKDYTVEFQVRELGSIIFKVKMCCIDTSKPVYAFFDNRDKDNSLYIIDSREEFLSEFYEFQKGGSYRRKNPIIKPDLDNLLETQKKLYEHLDVISLQINYCKNELKDRKLKEYFQNIEIDDVEFKKYIEGITNILSNDKFSIKKYTNESFYIIDNTSKKALMLLTFKQGVGNIEDLTYEDINYFEKYLK